MDYLVKLGKGVSDDAVRTWRNFRSFDEKNNNKLNIGTFHSIPGIQQVTVRCITRKKRRSAHCY